MAGIYSSSRPGIDELLFDVGGDGCAAKWHPAIIGKAAQLCRAKASGIKWYLHTDLPGVEMNSLYFSLFTAQEIPSR